LVRHEEGDGIEGEEGKELEVAFYIGIGGA